MDLIEGVDTLLTSYVEKFPNWTHPLMVFSTYAGSPVSAVMILILIMAAAYTYGNRRIFNSALFLLLAVPFYNFIKLLTRRQRPDTPYVELMNFKSYSFPSGHAYSSMLVFGLLAYISWRYLPARWNRAVPILLAVLVFSVGISRVYLGAHFPTDVIAGWLLGAAVLFLAIRVTAASNKIHRLKKP